jgi:hypothetical protein
MYINTDTHMKTMTRTLSILLLSISVSIVSGCADLVVENKNAPDRNLAITRPADVVGLIDGGYRRWALMVQWNNLITSAAQSKWGTGTVGNWWLHPGNNIPRNQEFPNTPTSSFQMVNGDLWAEVNGSIANANLALTAIANGVVIVDAKTTTGYKALAQLLQAVNYGSLGLQFDKAFVIDETTNLSGPISFLPYPEVIAAAVAKVEAAKATADQAIAAGSTAVPTGIIPALGVIDTRWASPGATLTWAQFKQIANSYAALFLAMSPRTVAENTAANWAQIHTYATNGINFDFAPVSNNDEWQSQVLRYIASDWLRVNQEVVKLMDPAQPALWPTDGSTPAAISTTDARFGTDFILAPTWSIFRPDRGQYKFSRVQYRRYFYHRFGIPAAGAVPFLLRAQNDLILAEAEMRRAGGAKANAVDMINRYRVGRGSLTAITAGDSDAVINAALLYEWNVEVGPTGLLATTLYNDRRLGRLVSGSLTQFPVPARELGVLLQPYYSFGGAPGSVGSAPKLRDFNEPLRLN